jgi:hypothetical protein
MQLTLSKSLEVSMVQNGARLAPFLRFAVQNGAVTQVICLVAVICRYIKKEVIVHS